MSNYVMVTDRCHLLGNKMIFAAQTQWFCCPHSQKIGLKERQIVEDGAGLIHCDSSVASRELLGDHQFYRL